MISWLVMSLNAQSYDATNLVRIFAASRNTAGTQEGIYISFIIAQGKPGMGELYWDGKALILTTCSSVQV